MVRTSTPLITSVLGYLFLGRELPGFKSVAALLTSLVGSAFYVYYDSSFEIRAYSWAAAWVCIFLFDQVYIKHVISTVPMSSWTRVYYTNILASVPVTVIALTTERAATNISTAWVVKGPMVTAAAVV